MAGPRTRSSCNASARGLASEVCRDTNDCIMTGGAGLRHGVGRLRYMRQRARHDAQCARQRFRSRYKFFILIGGGDETAVCARDTAYDMANARFDTAGHGHDMAPVCATTRRCAHGLSAVCTQPWPWVCTLCTQPSFDLGHCFESLFG